MRIVINDANILIDLIHLNIIDIFFQLENLELRTTDFVFEELLDEQKEILDVYIRDGFLTIIESTEEDLLRISLILNNTRGLSFEDCSVWYFAKSINAILLTGDGRLRKQSLQDGVDVRGILYVFDYLLLSGLITFELALVKINQLYQINNRLPVSAKDERLICWGRAEHVI